MTYNIRHAKGWDGRVDLPRIASVIADANPDLVGLQEVDNGRARSGSIDQAHALGEQLGMTAHFAKCLERGCEQYGIAMLSKLPVHETRQVILPADPKQNAPEPRSAQIARVSWGDIEIAFVNTHLSVSGRERAAQVTALLEHLDVDELIVVGDFNLTPWSRPYRSLATKLRSAAGAARTWPARLPFVPLDHILVRGPLQVVQAGAWKQGAARLASDHLPLVAELSRS
jgi:endonuclease/exonuclease/phosphatase family metal-dependent hydrolase